MRTKLLSIESGKWFLLSDRPDRAAVEQTIKELIGEGYKFSISENGQKFRREQIDLFEWAAQNPEGVEVKTRNLGHTKAYDLYHHGKLIAIK